MTRDEVLAEMVKVAQALERPGLKPEQIPSEDSETPENGSQEPTDPAQKHLAKIWGTLGGRRKKVR